MHRLHHTCHDDLPGCPHWFRSIAAESSSVFRSTGK
jgi:hypothetical protein